MSEHGVDESAQPDNLSSMAKTVIDLKLAEGRWDVDEVEVVDSRTGHSVSFDMLSPSVIAVDAVLADWITIRIVPKPRPSDVRD